MTDDAFDRILDVNLKGAKRMIDAVLPHMRQQRSGTIAITSSAAGHISMPGMTWYAATLCWPQGFSFDLQYEPPLSFGEPMVVAGFGVIVTLIAAGVWALRTRRYALAFVALGFLACLVPFVVVVGDAFGLTGSLGANPVEEILDRFGNWGLRFIVITLAITPLRRVTGWNWLARFRRMLGLYAFAYIALHFLVYLALDRALELDTVMEDIAERPFITIGFGPLVPPLGLMLTKLRFGSSVSVMTTLLASPPPELDRTRV